MLSGGPSQPPLLSDSLIPLFGSEHTDAAAKAARSDSHALLLAGARWFRGVEQP